MIMLGMIYSKKSLYFLPCQWLNRVFLYDCRDGMDLCELGTNSGRIPGLHHRTLFTEVDMRKLTGVWPGMSYVCG